ncbi:MAG: hypothetical protein K0R77_2364 [Chryseobacterium sp.]|jgi:hypothetical protein|uniref:hypothetical protein n=1 Tax=Chryseobacterium sp. TaxID=1871047 RepID=UPI002633EF68|nr:hypothetical protein [Chryseobacterium sp.]MDF2553089.1 hypothetical protein [Chryseobacterium sp.]
MKHLLLVIAILVCNNCFSQNDLELKIINDTIKKVSGFDDNNIFYALKNNSDKTYLIILDNNEFNEDGEYYVEPQFVGFPDYYIFEKKTLLPVQYAFHNGENKFEVDKNSSDFKNFRRSYSKFFSRQDLQIAFRISKKIVKLKPLEEKYSSTKVNFPAYKRRFIDLKNKSEYYFQMSLQIPKCIVDKYYQPIRAKNNKDSIFVGQIFSNKIPLIYKVYNDK